MCGIAGITGKTSQIQQRLARMNEAIAHRGPDYDACQFWSHGDSTTGFAHRRLSIIDLSDAGRKTLIADETQLIDNSLVETLQKMNLAR